jgi:large subunit ribosomal protein L18
LEKDVRSEIGYGGNRAAAAVVGRIVAERAVRAGVERVAFDRSGFRYHGRIEALADAAREAGLVF